MSTLLIANVGNSDVQIADPSLLPFQPGERVPARKLGAEIVANFERYAPALKLPLIGSALRWLLEYEMVQPDQLYVHLFASDQPQPPVTAEDEWNKDTCHFAEVIERYLTKVGLIWEDRTQVPPRQNTLRLPKKLVHIHIIEGNPADYHNMLEYFASELPKIAGRIEPDDRVFLEVSGGTPAMASMLLVAGVDVFGTKAQTLYIGRGTDLPYRVKIGHYLFAPRVRAAILAQIKVYAYASAKVTLEENEELLALNPERKALIENLLEYADSRLAFDFDRARLALHNASQYATGNDQSEIQYWLRELREANIEAQLTELIHSARIKYKLGDYADFAQRIFRFQEAVLRHLAERMGMRYHKGSDDQYVDLSWAEGVKGLSDFLKDYTAPDGTVYKPVDIAKKALNRVSLGAIVDFFVKNDPKWFNYRDTVRSIHRLSTVAALRNQGVSGHGFRGISKGDLAQAFEGDSECIIESIENIYRDLFGQNVRPDPYDKVNGMLCRLIERP